MIIKIMEGSEEGEVRCLACFMRFWPKRGTRKAKCPGCGIEWKISLSSRRPDKVSGADWEIHPTGDQI